MSSKWYQYAIEHLNAVTAAGDAMSKYTGKPHGNCTIIQWLLHDNFMEAAR